MSCFRCAAGTFPFLKTEKEVAWDLDRKVMQSETTFYKAFNCVVNITVISTKKSELYLS